MVDQIHVQLVGILGIDDRQHLVVGPFERRLFRKEFEPPADPGLTGHPGYPTGYLAQLASPFRAALWRSR